MKRLTIFALVILFIVASGCQKTPESPIVIGKDNTKLIDTAMDNKENKTLAQMLGVPARLVVSKTDGNGNITVEADAEIIIPDAEKISTMRIQKRSFTQAEADRILNYFIGEKEFNTRYAAGYDDMVEQLIRFKADLAKETDPEKRAALEQSIKKFESAGIAVPEGPEEAIPALKTFSANTNGGESIEGFSSDDNGNYFLRITNHPAENIHTVLYTKEQNGYATSVGNYWYEWQKANVEKVGLNLQSIEQTEFSLSEDEAKRIALNTLSALHIENMVLANCEKVWGGTTLEGGIINSQGRRAYQLRLVRSVGGALVTYADNDIPEGQISIDEDAPNKEVIALWPYESIEFIIDDTGVVEFVWKSPYELLETITDATALKSFDDIEAVFSKMMMVTKANPDQNVSMTFQISKAQLGLMRIKEKGNDDTALLIPVWDFFGTFTMDYTDKAGNKHTDTINDMYSSQLTINAVDGSIIDRQLGY